MLSDYISALWWL